jgi:CelD/BcsL family acetyltransferase involved in cellulose biosynthesis
MIRVRVLTTDAELSALQSGWDRLLAASAEGYRLFLSWDWIWAWWRCFGERYELLVLAAYSVDREGETESLIGLAPFAVCTGWPRTLCYLGNPEVASDHLDLIVQAGREAKVASAFSDALRTLRERWSVARLNAIRPGSHLAQVVIGTRRWGRVYRWRVAAPYIRLPESWDTYLSQRSRNFRYTLSRHLRRLQRDYPDSVRFEMISSPEALQPALDRLMALHQAVKASQGLKGAFADKRARKFHLRLAHESLRHGWLRLHELWVGDEVIASIYCFRDRHSVAFYQTGYALAWARYRPGQQIMAHAVCSAIAEGAESFDFLRGPEPYKQHWTETSVDEDYLLVPTGLLGALSIEVYRVVKLLRHRLRDLRARVAKQESD